MKTQITFSNKITLAINFNFLGDLLFYLSNIST